MESRVDLYETIHKALRARLFDLAIELDRCDFSQPLEVAVALSAYRRTMRFVREHHEHEDTHIEPALHQCSGGIHSMVTTQHARTDELLVDLDARVAALDSASEGKPNAGTELCARYRTFLADYLDHMAYEEITVSAALWKTFSDTELIQLRGRLQSSIPMPRFIEWLEILLPAINIAERTAMLRGLKANLPEPGFANVAAIASRVLGPSAWDAVRAQL